MFVVPLAFYLVVFTCRKYHVMPRETRWELWTAVSGLLALISRAYCNFSLWHHEFIKAAMSTRHSGA